MVSLNEKEIINQFQELMPLLIEWGRCVDTTLQTYLDSLGFSQERIQRKPESRVKNLNSYVQKALYRGKNYQNPIKDITDKVGTRVVLLNLDDVKTVSAFILGHGDWEVVDQSQDIDYIREHKPNEFGYQSNHFVVRPKEPKYSKDLCELLTCEIQVRTLLQHAYAEASHDTVYKSGHAEDPQVLRGLAVTMAFLETADDKIKFIYDKSKEVQTKRSSLTSKIAGIYRSIVPSYDDKAYDAGMTETFMSLFDDSFFECALSELSDFIEKREVDIKAALNSQQLPVLFQQPVSLLAFYAIVKKQSYLIENWPFTYDSLRLLLKSMGISDDVLS